MRLQLNWRVEEGKPETRGCELKAGWKKCFVIVCEVDRKLGIDFKMLEAPHSTSSRLFLFGRSFTIDN